MTRLFVATALVLHLSGATGVAAFVCTQPGMTVQTCCCDHDRADRSSPAAPVAAPVCPCAMAPAGPAPVTQTPVTLSTSFTFFSTPAILAAARLGGADTRSERVSHVVLADTGPSLLSASHLRC